MRSSLGEVPSIRHSEGDAKARRAGTLFAQLLLAFLLLIGGAWSQQAAATIGFCGVVANGPTSGSGAVGSNVGFSFTVQDDGNCNLVGTDDDIIITADTTGGASVTPTSYFLPPPSVTGNYPFTVTLGPSAGSVTVQVKCMPSSGSCDTNSLVTYTATTIAGSSQIFLNAGSTNADNDGSGSVTLGDVLTFNYTGTNTGTLPFTSASLSHLVGTPLSQTCGAMAVGAVCTLNATYTVTAADVVAGQTPLDTLSAVTMPGSTGSCCLNFAVLVVPTPPPGLANNKVLAGFVDNDGSGNVTLGDVLNYTSTATNTGGVSLTSVTITDPQTIPNSITCPSVPVAGTCVLSGSHTVTALDVSNGNVTNTSTATSIQTTSGMFTSTVVTPVVAGVPNLSNNKVLTGFTDNDGSGNVTLGDVLNYTSTATNSGTVPLTGVTVDDPQTIPGTATCPSLPIGGTCVLTGSHTVTALDVSNGNVTNTSTATSIETTSGMFTSTVVTPVFATPAAGMSVTKLLTSTVDNDTSGSVTPGDQLNYSVTANNTGGVNLTNVVVSDDHFPGTTTCPLVAPGGNCALIGSYVVTAGDAGAGAVNNTGSATSTQVPGPVTSSVSTPVSPTPAPGMSVTKTLTGTVDNDGSGSVTPGDQLNYSVTANNTGNVALNNVIVSDDHFPATNTCASVAVGGNCPLTGSYIVTAGDAGAGAVNNTGSATSTQVPGPVTNSVSTPVSPAPAPGMGVTKTLIFTVDNDGSGSVTPGDQLNYSVTARNTGRVNLTNVVVSDDHFPGTNTCASVAVGATCLLTGSYIVTAGDASAGSVNNTGSATSNEVPGPVTNSVVTPVSPTPAPALSIAKAVTGNNDPDGSGSVTMGDTLTYTVTATNSGNIPLTNVQVGDSLITPSNNACPNVAVGATCVLVGTYTVTAADARSGTVSNTGSSTSNETGRLPVTTTLNTPVNNMPALTVAKTLLGNSDPDGSGSVTEGDVLTYRVTATNSGNVPLTTVQVSDTKITPTSTTCPNVAVGQTCVLTGTYTVTANDARRGSIRNIGSASSNEVTQPVTDSLTTPVANTAGMTVSKVLVRNTDGDRSGTVTQGDTLIYKITATNTGNASLTNVQVSDPITSPSSTTCSTVPVNGTCALTASYTVTATDATNGSISNTGSATSTEVPGPISDTLNTPVAPSPAAAMSVSKVLSSTVDNDGSGTVTPGDQLNYAVTATNTGNVTLTNVVVSDNHFAGTTTCPSVAVGATCVLTGSYIVTGADATVGQVVNTGSAVSTQVPGAVTSSVSTPVSPGPVASMSNTKTLTGYDDNDSSGSITLNDVLHYSSSALNTGNVILNNVAVSDPKTIPNSASCASVAVGGTCVLQGNHTVTATDVNAGQIVNTSTATSATTGATQYISTVTTPVASTTAPSLSIVSGDNQAGAVGTPGRLPLVVQLLDGNGQPYYDETVNWQVVSGPATLNAPTSTTDTNGNAQIGLTYGNSAGAIVIRASYGSSSVDFHATALSYVITITGGNGQSGPPGSSLPQDFVVQVSLPPGITSKGPSPNSTQGISAGSVSGVPVQWQILSGGGSLSQGASTVTNASGQSTNHYTLGSAPGPNQIQVTVAGGNNVTFTANSVIPNPTSATMTIVSGNNQTLGTGASSAPLIVELKYGSGNPVVGATINWTASNATLASSSSITGSNGRASNVAKVTSPGAASVSASSASPAAGPVAFNLNGGLANIAGLTPAQYQLALALDNACPALAALSNRTPGQQDLYQQCLALAAAGGNPTQVQHALDELIASSAFLQSTAALQISATQFDNIKARIAALRSGTGGKHFGGLALNTPSGGFPLGSSLDALLSATDDKKPEVGADFDRWGFFASGTLGRGSARPGQVLAGYDFDTTGLTAGIDYRYSDSFIFGATIGYARFKSQLDGGNGHMNTSGYSLSGYSTLFRANSWYVDGVLTWGHNKYDITRRIVYTLTAPSGTTTIDNRADASASGTNLAGSLTVGRDFQKGGWSIGPYFRGNLAKLSFDDYRETLPAGGPGSGLGLDVRSRDVNSASTVLGGKFTYASSQSWGVLMPHMQVEWEHEFKSDPYRLEARFLNDPTATPIVVHGDAIDSDFFRLGFGLSAIWAGGKSGFVYYEKTLGRAGITQDNIALGLRIEF